MKQRARLRLALLTIAIVTAAACQVTPSPTPRPDSRQAAGADATSAHAVVQKQLDDIAASIDARDLAQAAALLAAIDLDQLDGARLFDAERLHVLLALAQSDPTLAEAWLDRMQPVSDAQRHDYTRLVARLAASQGRYTDAARVLIEGSESWNGDLQAVNDEIWNYVIRTPVDQIPQLAARSRTATARGWWALADALLHSFDVEAERAALAAWRRNAGDHPAANSPPSALAALRSEVAGPHRLALVVPLSGPLASAGAAVRDGFFAAFYRASADRTIRVYDSQSDAFPALYERIAADGMDVIVGPLDKAGVSAANQHAARLLPMLALNYLGPGEAASPDLLQLGLAIEDEAAAIVDRLTGDGIGRVALFWSESDWSQRAADTIRTGLADSTCEIVIDSYVADTRTVTDSVGAAFLVDASSKRGEELERILGTDVELVPRRRHDVDAIVALTDSAKARALVPALAFHFARDLPIYAPSPLLQGTGSGDLRDLEGARVTELPWRVYPDPVREAVEAAIPAAEGVLDSLYALGADAYRIVDRIGTFGNGAMGGATLRMLGATGMLTLDETGAIHREPVWVVVQRGAMVALPTLVPAAD